MNQHIIHLKNGRLAEDTPFNHVQQLVSNAINHVGSGGIVVHFHGGLVSEAKGREIANRLTPVYQDAHAYPIFPVWESGLIETIINNFSQIAGESFFQTILLRARRIVGRKFAQDEGGRSVGVLPPVDFTLEEKALIDALGAEDDSLLPSDRVPTSQLTPLSATEQMTIEAELQQDAELLLVVQEVSNGLRNPNGIVLDEATRSAAPVVASSATLMDPATADRLVDRPDPSSRGIISTAKLVKAIVKVAVRVTKRYISNRDHGFHATIVEEILREFYLANIGGAIWSQMKQDTADSFGPNPQVFGGTALLTELAKGVQLGAQPKVTLIGHSTGAVYISHLLKAADAILPEDFKFDILLLAPASTFDLLAETLTGQQERIGGFRMFTMADNKERQDRLVPFLYPHSLLYFVSGVVESYADIPIIGMQRFYDESNYEPGEFPNVECMRRYIRNMADWVVWSTGLGPHCKAVSHGDFDDDPTTLLSIKNILRNGF
ncbi:MAG: hypothetical protein IH613_13375 [Desulfuromonadales bacterium]|nr:hypothetical protein [Desulfuromonadales bacterium]